MKLKATEKNFNRLAYQYDLDVYEHNHEFSLFNNKTNEIFFEHIPDMETIIKETVDVFNYNIQRNRYDKTNANTMFNYY